MISRALVATLATLVVACAHPEQAREARTTYNAALDLRENQHWDAAVRAFTEARAGAGADGELRFRAALELGSTLVAWADVASAAGDVEAAAGRLRQAVTWFGDAARLRPEDATARNNLEVAVTRLRQLGDQLTAGKRSLAARLDRALADQRRVRDQLRQLDAALAGGAIEPAAVDAASEALETAQRTLNADTGVVGDLAAAERSSIEGVADADRDDRQRARLAQLAALVGHVDRGRAAGGAVRAAIRKALVSRAVDRSEAAVVALVRAREQLLDPGQLIRGLIGDQDLLARESRVVATLRSGAIQLEATGEPPEAPPHLLPARLGARQTGLAERAGELSARLGAVSASGDSPDGDARQLLARASPFVTAAVAAMKQAAEHLSAEALEQAVERQREALVNLARALEYFADVRGLIELTWAEQKQLVERLESDKPDRHEIAEALTLNRERLERLSILLARERQAAEAEAKKNEAGAEATQAIAARFDGAERHRTAALAALAQVESKGLDPARAALAELEELRRLFFSVVEHLKDLHRRQTATRDRTSAAQNAADDQRAPVLGEIAAAQAEHFGMGSQIAAALAAQADQASKAPAQGQADAGERLAAAADEVRQGSARMESAAAKLGEASANAATESVDLEPPLADQAAAIEHLAKAIAILEPPKQQKKKDQKQQQDQPQQDQQQQESEPGEQDLSQSEVEKRLRAIREREADRRRQRSRSRRVTVEKDW